ncbi:unnamed protein product [Thelazia callipaeda]|uniref:TIMELESS-interacting protein n=1 Tax=Thelazia callipaeda TaxID=103827 RepID=A0A0N5CJA9_THECL|nr:unnamed protein product [Thelazia callipaeda]
MDNSYDLEDDEEKHAVVETNGVFYSRFTASPSDEQVLNDLLKKGNRKVRKRRAVQQPKLRDIELCGSKGFLELRRMFDNYTPKNKNPYKDLLFMMNRIEYWGHLLCPKMRFEDFVTRVESLSGKRLIKTTLTKMRLDMPLTDEDFHETAEDKDISHTNGKPAHAGKNEFSSLPLNDSDLFEVFGDLLDESPSTKQSSSSSHPLTSKLSFEQLQRIESNKLRAQQLLLQREKRKHCDLESVSTKAEQFSINKENVQKPNTLKPVNEEESQEPKKYCGETMLDENEALAFLLSPT